MNSKGFSLVELIVVLGMLATASGVAMINFSGYSVEHRGISQDAQILASSIRYAQQMSTQGRATQILPGTYGFTIRARIPNPIYANNQIMADIERHYFSDNVTFDTGTLYGNVIRFTNRGTLSYRSYTVHLNSPNYRVSLTTTIGGGRVNIGAIYQR